MSTFSTWPTCNEGVSCQYVAKQSHLLGDHSHPCIWASCCWSAHDLQRIVLLCRGQWSSYFMAPLNCRFERWRREDRSLDRARARKNQHDRWFLCTNHSRLNYSFRLKKYESRPRWNSLLSYMIKQTHKCHNSELWQVRLSHYKVEHQNITYLLMTRYSCWSPEVSVIWDSQSVMFMETNPSHKNAQICSCRECIINHSLHP